MSRSPSLNMTKIHQHRSVGCGNQVMIIIIFFPFHRISVFLQWFNSGLLHNSSTSCRLKIIIIMLIITIIICFNASVEYLQYPGVVIALLTKTWISSLPLFVTLFLALETYTPDLVITVTYHMGCVFASHMPLCIILFQACWFAGMWSCFQHLQYIQLLMVVLQLTMLVGDWRKPCRYFISTLQ